MAVKYRCPICGYQTMFASRAASVLHETVSHSGQEPVVEIPVSETYIHTGFEAGAL